MNVLLYKALVLNEWRLRSRRISSLVILLAVVAIAGAGPAGMVAALDYGYPWDGLVSRFKFHGEPGWAATFAGLMRAAQ